MTSATPALRHGRGSHKIVVMGGWLGVASHWQGFLEAVDPAAFEVAVFDYRGYGTRRDVVGQHTFVEAAHDVLDMVSKVGWAEFSLIGHSMGGMAMQRVALAAGGRVRHLVGIAPVSAAGSSLDATRLEMFVAAVSSVEARQRIINFSTGQRLTPRWTAAVAQSSWVAHAPQAMAGYLGEWTRDGFEAQARKLDLPTLLLVGEHDPSINKSTVVTTWLRHHPHAAVEEVAGVGHYPMQEAPVYTATRVQSFLTG